MEKTKIITSNTKNKLSYAIAIACEIRLRVYMENKSKVDNIISLESNIQNTEIVLKIAGATTTINYFQITYCLQCEVAKQLNFTKLHFYSDPLLINFTIGFVFGMKDLGSHFKINRLKVVWSLSEFDFDDCMNISKNHSVLITLQIRKILQCIQILKNLLPIIYYRPTSLMKLWNFTSSCLQNTK